MDNLWSVIEIKGRAPQQRSLICSTNIFWHLSGLDARKYGLCGSHGTESMEATVGVRSGAGREFVKQGKNTNALGEA